MQGKRKNWFQPYRLLLPSLPPKKVKFLGIYLSIFKVHPANDLNVFYIDVHTYYTLVLPVHSKYILQIFPVSKRKCSKDVLDVVKSVNNGRVQSINCFLIC